MTDARKQARRELEFQEQVKAHGGTGSPPDLDPIEAIRQGRCPRCGGRWDALHTHVWRHYVEDKRLMAEGVRLFREEFKVPGDVKLLSEKARETQRQAKLRQMSGPNGQRIKAQIAVTLARPRPDLRAIRSWPMVRLLTSGTDQVEAAKELGAADHSTIGKRAKSLGLSLGTSFLSDHGAPFRNGDLFDLREASGFESLDFDRCAGLSEGRSNGARPRDPIANPKDAKAAIDWRDGVLRALLSVAVSGERALRLGTRVFRQDEVLKRLLPNLAALNDALIATMPKIREAARKHPEWTADELCEEICVSAEIEENAESGDMRWRVTMQSLWQAEGWIAANLERLRATEVQNDGPLVREMIGSRYGASQLTVQNALRDRTGLIAPTDTWTLIKNFAPKFAEAKPKAGGAPKGLRAGTRERIRRIAALEAAGWTQERMAPFVFWDTPGSCHENIRPFASTYRNHINEVKHSLSKTEIQETVRAATEFLAAHRS